MTQEILRLAEKDGIQSISFPALGTGNVKRCTFLIIKVLGSRETVHYINV